MNFFAFLRWRKITLHSIPLCKIPTLSWNYRQNCRCRQRQMLICISRHTKKVQHTQRPAKITSFSSRVWMLLLLSFFGMNFFLKFHLKLLFLKRFKCSSAHFEMSFHWQMKSEEIKLFFHLSIFDIDSLPFWYSN